MRTSGAPWTWWRRWKRGWGDGLPPGRGGGTHQGVARTFRATPLCIHGARVPTAGAAAPGYGMGARALGFIRTIQSPLYMSFT